MEKNDSAAALSRALPARPMDWRIPSRAQAAANAPEVYWVLDWWIAILPYVIVLVVLAFYSQRLRMPRADGLPYRRGET